MAQRIPILNKPVFQKALSEEKPLNIDPVEEQIFRDRRIPQSTSIVSNAKPINEDRRNALNSINATPWYLKVRYAKHGLN